MSHRRTSGAKVRSHKLGFDNAKFQNKKQARLRARRVLAEYGRISDMGD